MNNELEQLFKHSLFSSIEQSWEPNDTTENKSSHFNMWIEQSHCLYGVYTAPAQQ